ncbi:MAG: ABC transporter ATP-binding protein [SAR324 cluster bacterium]|nr:ABC transporter ATP-binding protein [SAR324 cluster bacterium]
MPHHNQILVTLIKTRKVSYAFSILTLVLASFFAFTIPYIGKISIDRIIDQNAEPQADYVQSVIDFLGGKSYLSENLWISGGLILLTTGLYGLFMYLKDYFSASACESLLRELRNRLFHQIQHLPNTFYSGVDTGDLLQRCTSDIDTLREFLTHQVMNLGRIVILVIVVVPLMLIQDVKMTLISLMLVPLVVIYALHFFGKIKIIFRKVDEAEGELTTIVQENLTGIRVVRAFARQDFENMKFENKNKKYRDLNYQLIQLLSRFWSISDLMCFSQVGLVLIAGSWMVGQEMITMGTFFAFLIYTSMLIWPLRELGKELNETGKAVVAIGRIHEILEQEPELQPQKALKLPQRIKGEIEFRNVSFGYDPEDMILRNLSFKIRAGETVAILGPTGSGKSTLIQLLLRLYDYQQGSILLDNQELKKMNRSEIRSQIGTLLQEPYLFNRTLGENIKFGKKDASDQAMVESAKMASIHQTILAFEHGYKTVIGERGVSLSGGQRQRVTLSRTFLKEPPILILDDTLSAVDTKTEQKILEAMREKHGHSTTLMITHRISCCLQSDRILVLKDGTLDQEGTHESLLRVPGFYQELWNIQMGQKEDFQLDLQKSFPRSLPKE